MATPRRRGVMAYDNLGGSTVRTNASALLCAQRMRVAPARLARGGPIAHATQSRTQCGCAGMSDWNAIHIYRCRFNARPRCLLDKLFGALNELLPPPHHHHHPHTGRAWCDPPSDSHEWLVDCLRQPIVPQSARRWSMRIIEAR